jgi:hypothetical protein
VALPFRFVESFLSGAIALKGRMPATFSALDF